MTICKECHISESEHDDGLCHPCHYGDNIGRACDSDCKICKAERKPRIYSSYERMQKKIISAGKSKERDLLKIIGCFYKGVILILHFSHINPRGEMIFYVKQYHQPNLSQNTSTSALQADQ